MRRLALAVLAVSAALVGGEGALACTYDAKTQRLTVTDEGQPYAGAEGKAWLIKGEPIMLLEGRYEKLGAPIELGAMDFAPLVKMDDWQGVMVFGDPWQDFETVLVPLDAKACTFQRYGIKE